MPAAKFEAQEPATAVQVAAALGDSVVGLARVSNPGAGVYERKPQLLLAAGTLLLLAAACSFFVALDNAVDNAADRASWTAAGQALDGWRPRLISPVHDWLAVGGCAVGLTLIVLGVWRAHDERRATSVRIGSGPDADIAAYHRAFVSFPLVVNRGDHFAAVVTADMNVRLVDRDGTWTLADLVADGRAEDSSVVPEALEIAIVHGVRITARVGQVALLISPVEQHAWQSVALRSCAEWLPLRFLAGSTLAHMAVWALLMAIPPDPASVALEFEPTPPRMTRRSQPVEPEPVEPEPVEPEFVKPEPPELWEVICSLGIFGGAGEKRMPGQAREGEGESPDKSRGKGTGKAEGDASKVQRARRHLSPDQGQGQGQDQTQVQARLEDREQALARARQAGLVGVLRAQGGGAFASMTGGTEFSFASMEGAVSGGLVGDEWGAMADGFGFSTGTLDSAGGGFGYGRLSFGEGSSGTHWSLIGTGTTGPGYQPRRRTIACGQLPAGSRPCDARKVLVRIGAGEVSGELDEALVRRHLRRSLSGLKNCHRERQLAAGAGSLVGTVQTRIVIGPNGKAMSVTAEGGDRELGECFAGVIEATGFPRSESVGVTTAEYPINVHRP